MKSFCSNGKYGEFIKDLEKWSERRFRWKWRVVISWDGEGWLPGVVLGGVNRPQVTDWAQILVFRCIDSFPAYFNFLLTFKENGTQRKTFEQLISFTMSWLVGNYTYILLLYFVFKPPSLHYKALKSLPLHIF